jgi:fluoroquinolone transport system permease protein
MTTYNYMIQSDWKIIGRDPMLAISLVAPILLTCVSLFGVPLVADLSQSMFNFPLDEYVPFMQLFFLPICPMMIGMIYGFILLDERDGGLIGYLSVTPLGKSGYLKVRMIVPVIYSFVFSIVYLFLTGLASNLNIVQQLLLSVIFSLGAPLMLLFLGAFAGNKVEGMAISKGFGILLISMFPSHFFNSHWLNLLGISPLWWVERAIFGPLNTWLYLVGGIVVHLFFIVVLYRKFVNRFG